MTAQDESRLARGSGHRTFTAQGTDAVASAEVLIEKLLETTIRVGANDLHITVGQKPILRHQGRLRPLDTKVLTADDTMGLMKSITPDRCQQEIQERGGADFAIEVRD